MRRSALIGAAFVTALLAMTAMPALAGGGGHGAQQCAGFSEGASLGLRDYCLDGTAHFLPAGQDLRIVNEGQQAHDYVAVDGSFETGRLAPGEEATLSNPGPGTHRVWCTLHASPDGAGMAGVLVVEDVDGGAAAAGSAAPGDASGDTRPAWRSAGSGWVAVGTASGVLALGLAAFIGVGRRPWGAQTSDTA